jgi:hypothetical protein
MEIPLFDVSTGQLVLKQFKLTLLRRLLIVVDGADIGKPHYIAECMANGRSQHTVGSHEDPAYIPPEYRRIQKLET